MIYYNLKISVLLKQDIKYEHAYEIISNIIFHCIAKSNELKEIYKENIYPMYNFCNLYLPEKDRIYKKNKVYFFDIKFLNLKFAIKLKQFLSMYTNDYFKILMSSIKTNEYHKISKLNSLTPSIITTSNCDYNINKDIELVSSRIVSNTQKKHYHIYGEIIEKNFIQDIIIINQKPIKVPYKNINFMGNKFEIHVKQDIESQKLAHTALSVGILEKNKLGFGFCTAK